MAEQIVKRETRTRPAGFGEAWLFSFWGGLAAVAAAAGIILCIETGDLLWLAMAVGSGAFWAVLMDRKRLHDERAFQVVETYAEPDIPTPLPRLPDQPVQPWIVNRNGAGQHIQHGKLTLSLKQWQTLGKVFLDNGKLTRSILASAGVFENVTNKYPDIQKEFTRLGLFDGNGLLTDSGRAFWKGFLTPTPLGFNGTVASVPPTTTDDDGRGVSL